VGLTWAGVAVASVVAIGASYITSRIINGNPNKGSNSAGNQGGRIQLPPASNNKIPVVYGQAYMNGIITDAWLTDENKTMYYCVVLSETCNVSGATYTVNDIYWNDMRLVFETTSNNRHKVNKGVKTVTTTDDTEDSFVVDSTNLAEFRVYAGDSTSAKQIFPLTDTPVNAYTYWPDSKWTSANRMEGLVFAIVKVRYDQNKGFTSLPNLTFKITNSINNPAEVWRDYMTSKRYGAGVATATIPTGSGTAYDTWYNYCDELIRYTDKDASSATQRRYQINGVVDTSQSCKTNIDSILQNGGAWMSYDVSTGYWRPIIKKAVTAAFTASRTSTTLTVSAFTEGRIEPGMTIYNSSGSSIGKIVSQTTPLTSGETTGQVGRYTMDTSGAVSSQSMTGVNLDEITLAFNDNNILTGISISSTSLTDLYNAYECEFFDKYNKDQRAYTRAELSAGLRNANEPDNVLRMSLEFCNNSVQADIIGNMELRQSRDDLVIEFTASHYGIQAQAGDIIGITNDIYGWAPKYFRVMRTKEIEREDGGLVAQITALEYNPDVYTVESITEFTTEENIGIAPFSTTGTNTANILTPDDDRVSVVQVNDTASVPNIVIVAKIPTSGGPYDEIQIWYAVGPTTTSPSDNAYSLLIIHKPPPPAISFNLGKTIYGGSVGTTSERFSTFNSGYSSLVAHGLEVGDQLYYYSADAIGLTENTLYYYIPNEVTLPLTVGRTYVIYDLGTTTQAVWNTLAGTSGVTYAVGDSFVAAVAGNQTGTGLVTNIYELRLSLTEGGAAVNLTGSANFTLDTCHAITLSGLPSNATGQKYYFKTRVGSRQYYSTFTDPDSATVATPTTPYAPGGSSAGFNLSGATEGETIYYDATTGTWRNNYILSVSDTSNWVRIETPFVKSTEQDNYLRSGLAIEKRITDATANDDNEGGPALLFTRSFGAHTNSTTASNGREGFAVVGANFRGTDDDHSINISIANTGENLESALGGSTIYTGKLGGTTIRSFGSATSGDIPVMRLEAQSSGTTGLNFGPGLYFDAEYPDGVVRNVGWIAARLDDITSGSEDAVMVFRATKDQAADRGEVSIDSEGNIDQEGKIFDINSLSDSESPVPAGVSGTGLAGIRIGRGSLSDATLYFNESTDNFELKYESGTYIDLTANDLTLQGNDIKSSSATAITLSGADVVVAGDLTVTGNDIKSSSATAITLSGSNVSIPGDLAVDTNTLFVDSINNRVGIGIAVPSYTLDVQGNTYIGGDLRVLYDLQVEGNDIKSSTGATAITLSGSDVTIAGNLTINGTTTTVNSTVTTIDDPIITLGGDTAPVSDDNKDRGVEFRYYDTQARLGFFGYDDSQNKFVFLTQATNTSEVFSGTKGEIDASVDWSNILNKPDPVITLAGDLSGTVTLTDLASGTLTATIVANAVALGTDTTGNYVATVSAGTGISVSGSGVETAAVTVTNTDLGSSQNIFKNVAVSGQSTVVADSNDDTLTFAGSTGLTITTDATTDTITFTNSGVTSIAGTTNQITASASTGSITLSTPQDIHTGANPTFAGATLGNILVGVTGDNELDTSSGNLTIDSAGGTTTIDDELIVSGDLQVTGNDIKNSAGTVSLTFDALQNVTVQGDLTISGNELYSSSGRVAYLVGTELELTGSLRIDGNTIKASDNNTNITMTSNTLTTFAGDIKVTGNDIQSSTGATAITLSGADVTIPGNLTVDTSTLFVDATNNIVGIGTATPGIFGNTSYPLEVVGATNGAVFTRTSTAANTNNPIILLKDKGATARAVNDGLQILYGVENTTSVVYGAALRMICTDATAASEDYDFTVQLMQNGAATAERFRVASTGDVTVVGDIRINGNDIKASDGTTAITLSSNDVTIADKLTVNGALLTANAEDLANAAAVSLTVVPTYIETGAAGETATLAAGTAGQFKTFAMTADGGGDMVITVTNAAWGGAGTMTFNAVGQGCTLQYINSKWCCVGNNAVTFA
jgi:hypothetical protein